MALIKSARLDLAYIKIYKGENYYDRQLFFKRYCRRY